MKFFSKILMKFRVAFRYFQYLICSRHWRGFGIHSPFVFNFYQKIIKSQGNEAEIKKIRKIRSRLTKSHQYLYTKDYGTGSAKATKHYWLPVKKAVRKMSVPQKYGKILYRLARYYSIANILEIGTGIGVSTLYMAFGNPSASIFSIEGCPQKSSLARELFEDQKLNNIQVWVYNFEDILPVVLRNMRHSPDLVFIDGNHRKDSTIRYFETILPGINNETIIVFDDIHWSKGMEEAWHEIQNYGCVTVTIDLFRLGIVFFKKELSKQNFIIRY
jgi:predicted O-methyltransferase YrrM